MEDDLAQAGTAQPAHDTRFRSEGGRRLKDPTERPTHGGKGRAEGSHVAGVGPDGRGHDERAQAQGGTGGQVARDVLERTEASGPVASVHGHEPSVVLDPPYELPVDRHRGGHGWRRLPARQGRKQRLGQRASVGTEGADGNTPGRQAPRKADGPRGLRRGDVEKHLVGLLHGTVVQGRDRLTLQRDLVPLPAQCRRDPRGFEGRRPKALGLLGANAGKFDDADVHGSSPVSSSHEESIGAAPHRRVIALS